MKISIIFSILIIIVFFTAGNIKADTWRVENEIIKEGTSVFKLLKFAGPPDYVEYTYGQHHLGLDPEERIKANKIYFYQKQGNILWKVFISNGVVRKVRWER